MARRIVILLLVSSAALYLFQDAGPGVGAAAGSPLSVVAAAGRDDDDVCGECPWSQSEADCRHHGVLSAAVLAQGSGAARPAPNVSGRHGRGPTLSSLSDSLILSRPPPPLPTTATDRRDLPTRIE